MFIPKHVVIVPMDETIGFLKTTAYVFSTASQAVEFAEWMRQEQRLDVTILDAEDVKAMLKVMDICYAA